MRHFTEYLVWQKAHAFLLRVYRETRHFPDHERFGVTSQLRRAALSVPTNIVEGSRRSTQAEFARFLNISQSSAAETEYLLMVSHDLEYLATETYESLLAELLEVAKMLHALHARVEEAAALEGRSQLSALSSQPSSPR